MKYVAQATDGQELLFLFQELYPSNPLYNQCFCFEMKGKIDMNRLIEKLKQFVNTHDILMSNYVRDANGRIMQIDLGHQVEDCIRIKSNMSLEEALTEVEIDKNMAFDLTKENLFFVKFFIIEKDCFIFSGVVHHIVSDAYSMFYLIEWLIENYENKSEPVPVLQFNDYLKKNSFSCTDSYKNIVKEYSEDILFTQDRTGVYPCFTTIRELSRELHCEIARVSKKFNITPFVCHLAAYAFLVSRISRENHVCLGIPFAGRRSRESRKIFGYLVNIQPLILNLGQYNTFAEL